MTTPRRIQRHRTKGWRLPAYAVTVTRPGPWGNPFKAMRTPAGWVVTTCTSYRTSRHAALADEANATGPFPTEIAATRAAILAFRRYHDNEMSRARIRKNLQGKVLACWCKPGAACHADVLLEYANDSTPTTCDQRPADATAEKTDFSAPGAPRNAAPAPARENSADRSPGLQAMEAEFERMLKRGEVEKTADGKYKATAKFPHATEAEIDRLLDLRNEDPEP